MSSGRVFLGGLGVAAVVAYTGVAGRQTVPEKPWTSYGGHADSSRYFDSKHITKANVSQLQVAWTYPHGETVFHPLIVRGTVYGRGRNGALVALDARTGKELWVHDGMRA